MKPCMGQRGPGARIYLNNRTEDEIGIVIDRFVYGSHKGFQKEVSEASSYCLAEIAWYVVCRCSSAYLGNIWTPAHHLGSD